MAFRKKFERIISEKPDVIVIQECEHEEKLQEALKNTEYENILWYGKNKHKGVGIITTKDNKISLNPMYNSDFEYVIPIKFEIKKIFMNIFIIWAMPHNKSKSKSYVGQVWNAINFYREELKHSSILIGDFNSNAIWDRERKNGNHTDVVNFLDQLEIRSIYHLNNNCDHGKEKQATFYLLKNKLKPYHMDYCFVSQSLMSKSTTMKIGDYENWIKLSDHMPLVIDNLNIL